MNRGEKEWLKEAETVTAFVWKRRRNRKRRKPRLMEAMLLAENARVKSAETRAENKRRRADALKPPALTEGGDG